MNRVLVVDDDPAFAGFLVKLISETGDLARAANGSAEAEGALGAFPADAVVLDLQLGSDSGIDLLPRFRTLRPTAPILIVTAYGSIRSAVAAIKAGADDFIQKPMDNQEFLRKLRGLLGRRARRATEEVPEPIGRSAAFVRVVEQARRVARSDLRILLLGETGTGKDVFARAIHRWSAWASGPFVALDCAAVPDTLLESELFGHERGAFTGATAQKQGRFELASGGTLFLDEIGNVPVGLQHKLLRAVETRSAYRVGGTRPVGYNARLIAATNADLEAGVRTGAFRPDLYHRLREVALRLPPLRERKEDIGLLCEHFVRLYAGVRGVQAPELGAEVLSALERYAWPGNTRELKSTMKAAVVMAEGASRIERKHIPEEVLGDSPTARTHVTGPRLRVEFEFALREGADVDIKALGGQAARAAERALLEAMCNGDGGARSRLARRLGIDEKTLRAKLKMYGIGAAGAATREPGR